MQPRRLLLVIAALGALGGLIAYRASRPTREVRVGPAVRVVSENAASLAMTSSVSPAQPAVAPPARAAEGPVAEAPASDPAPASEPSGTEQSLQRIEAAVVTYEVASLPAIAPYLTHADPELRLAAREGMLQMGLSEAVPLLREAAGKIKDPREAILLLDAADFLELPSVPATGGKKRRPHPVAGSSTPPAGAAGRR